MRPAAGGGFFVEATGFEEAAGFVSDLQRAMKEGLKGRLGEAAEIVSREAGERTHSARVRAAMTVSVRVKSLTEFEARIGPSRRRAWFAHFLEGGTPPHTIVGAFKKGSDITVSHPGHRAFPFLEPALAATADQVTEIVGFPPELRRGYR